MRRWIMARIVIDHLVTAGFGSMAGWSLISVELANRWVMAMHLLMRYCACSDRSHSMSRHHHLYPPFVSIDEVEIS